MSHHVAAIVIFLLISMPCLAQPDVATVRGDSVQTRKRLAEAQQKLLTNPNEAADDLLRIIDESGDDLIPIDDIKLGTVHKHYRPAYWLAQYVLASRPDATLAAYRARIDDTSRKLLEAGRRERDPRPLWQLVERYFLSPHAIEGSVLLGDMLFERGQFRSAEMIWRRIARWPTGEPLGQLLADSPDLIHPDPLPDPAAIHARIILAVIFQREINRARDELVRFAVCYPSSRGRLAGREGKYCDILSTWLNYPPKSAAGSDHSSKWTTFAGSPSRDGHTQGRMPRYWPSRPNWTRSLFNERDNPNAARWNRQPLGYPIIDGGVVYLHDSAGIRGFYLRTGLPLGSQKQSSTVTSDTTVLNCDCGRLYARFSDAVQAERIDPIARQSRHSSLVAFQPLHGPLTFPLSYRELWRIPAQTHRDSALGDWVGSPLVVDGRLWAVAVRNEGGRSIHSLVAFDPVIGERMPDRPAWAVEVCEAPIGSQHHHRHALLTLAGRHIVYNTNAGVVVAVEASTGRRSWAFSYAESTQSPRELSDQDEPAPAVSAGGRIYIAPADADRVIALDESTGKLLWISQPAPGARILGVTQQRVIVTTRLPMRGIRALSTVNGSYQIQEGGWIQCDGGGLATFGRGLVSDDVVFWPTRSGLFLIDPRTGRPMVRMLNALPPPRDGLYGHLAYADGVLVVATPNDVCGYIAAHSEPLEEDRKEFDRLIGAVEDAIDRSEVPGVWNQDGELACGRMAPHHQAWAIARFVLSPMPQSARQTLLRKLHQQLTPQLLSEWLVTTDGLLITLGELVARYRDDVRISPSPRSRILIETRPQAAQRHHLTDDADVVSTINFPAPVCPVAPLHTLTARDRHLFALSGSRLLELRAADGNIRVRQAHGAITHAAELDEGCITAGPDHVALYRGDSVADWVFRVPTLEPVPSCGDARFLHGGEHMAPEQLSSFVLVGSLLFARLGDHHLLALDLAARRVAWVLGSDGKPGYFPHRFPTHPRFGASLIHSDAWLVVQLTDGRNWIIHAATGSLHPVATEAQHGGPIASFGATQTRFTSNSCPIELAPGRIVIADGPGVLKIMDIPNGSPTVAYEATHPTSLSGVPPGIRTWNGLGLVAIHRNHGIEVDRWNVSKSTTALWSTPHFLNATGLRLDHADTDAQRVYIPIDHRLCAIDWATGKAHWTVELPKSSDPTRWIVRVGQHTVLVYPETPIRRRTTPDRLDRTFLNTSRYASGQQLPNRMIDTYDAWVDRLIPLLVLDPPTGRLLKRIDLPAYGLAQTVSLHRETVVIVTGKQMHWLQCVKD